MLLPKDYVRFQPHRRIRHRSFGRLRHGAVRRGEPALVVRNDGWRWAWTARFCPTCHESSEVTGTRHARERPKLTGLAEGTPVVGGGGDQASSAVGNGIVEAGIVSCTLGTSGVVFAHMEQVAYDPAGRVHTFCHAVRGKWHVMGVTQGAGLSLQWFRNQLAPGADYDALTAEAATAPAGAQGLFWLPYLMGERTPHLDATARGGWIGLTARHTRADLIRAVIEGVSYSQRDCLEIIEGLGVPRRIGARFRRRRDEPVLAADCWPTFSNKRVVTLETQEGSAYGAALLALAGTGEYGIGARSLPCDDSGGGFDRAAAGGSRVLCEGASHLWGTLSGVEAGVRRDREVGLNEAAGGPALAGCGRASRRRGHAPGSQESGRLAGR